jgi:hypothetical protein
MKPGDVVYDDCLAFREADWMDDGGTATKPLMGDRRTPHHGLCYRIWNLDMATAARVPEVDTEVEHRPVDWDALRRSYLESLPPVVTPPIDGVCPGPLSACD